MRVRGPAARRSRYAAPVKRALQLLLVLLAIVCAACGGTASSGTPSIHTTPASPTPTPIPPLAAPAVVQVENSPDGRPQSGLGAADIVYEYVAEGGVGRFSLLFFQALGSQQQVGPVRSARTVTIALVQQYHGFLAYSGASTYITHLLNSAGFPSYNETGAQGDLFRVNSRYAPHNLYTDGQHLTELATRAGLSATSYQLWKRSSAVVAGGTAMHTATVPISMDEQPMWTWHPELNGFTRTEDTGVVNDPTTKQPVVIPTVIVQQVNVTTDANVVDVNGVTGVDHDLTSGGAAQILTNGRVYNATWQQSADGPPTYVLANGQPAPIASGEVWICLVPTGSPAVIA